LRKKRGCSEKKEKKNMTKTNENEYPVTLSDELSSVELGNNRFQDLIHNRRENSLIIIGAESAKDLGKLFNLRPGQHTKSDIHHLQIYSFTARK
jgi:hypothetical protein